MVGEWKRGKKKKVNIETNSYGNKKERLITITVFIFPGDHMVLAGIWDCFLPLLVAQTVKNLPAMQETQVQPLGQKDPLEKGLTTHSSILAWRIPWTEEFHGPQSMRSRRVGHD